MELILRVGICGMSIGGVLSGQYIDTTHSYLARLQRTGYDLFWRSIIRHNMLMIVQT